MKKGTIFLTAFAAFTLMLGGCKKSSDTPANNNPSASNLDAGKAIVKFTSNPGFGGATTFNISNTTTTPTTATTLSSSSLRNVSISATDVNLSGTARIAQFLIILPVDASTSGGNLTADFSLPNGATILPTLALTSSPSGAQYASESGTLTITKLTATEIEGTFSCTVKEVTGTATLSITEGSFAGKF
ncbi:MAG TPA: hypothetical protein PLC48_01715 [Ferruginibacter sp.]|nr:hypothetical protein [Ferruginibacter sp.]